MPEVATKLAKALTGEWFWTSADIKNRGGHGRNLAYPPLGGNKNLMVPPTGLFGYLITAARRFNVGVTVES